MRISPVNLYNRSYSQKTPVFKSEQVVHASNQNPQTEETKEDNTKKYLAGAAILAGIVLLGFALKHAFSGKGSKNLKENLSDTNLDKPETIKPRETTVEKPLEKTSIVPETTIEKPLEETLIVPETTIEESPQVKPKKILKVLREKLINIHKKHDEALDKRYFRKEREKDIKEDIDYYSAKMEDIITDLEPQPIPKSVEELIEIQKDVIKRIYSKK